MHRVKAATRERGRPRAGASTDLSRETILARALSLFAEIGFQGFSVRALARDLGVSHGLMNIRFGTKEELWRAAVEWGLAQLAERLDRTPRAGPIEDRFRQAVVATLLAIDAVPALLQLVNHEAATESARLTFLTDTIIKDRYAVLEDVVREGTAAGAFRNVPPNLVFLMVAHGGGAAFALRPLSERLGLLDDGNESETMALSLQIAEFALRAIRA